MSHGARRRPPLRLRLAPGGELIHAAVEQPHRCGCRCGWPPQLSSTLTKSALTVVPSNLMYAATAMGGCSFRPPSGGPGGGHVGGGGFAPGFILPPPLHGSTRRLASSPLGPSDPPLVLTSTSAEGFEIPPSGSNARTR